MQIQGRGIVHAGSVSHCHGFLEYNIAIVKVISITCAVLIQGALVPL